jgi:hypothetical protein
MVEAVRHPGFALLDVWDLCTAYFVPNNKIGRKGLESTIDALGFDRGVLYERDVEEYGAAYRAAAEQLGPRREPRGIPAEFEASIESPLSVVVAGSAGAKVRSAARLLGEGAIRSGLWATLRGDYPVTVKTGHSVAQVVMSPNEMPPIAVTRPDVLVLASEDGLKKVGGMLQAMGPDDLVVTVPEFADLETPARVEVFDPKAHDARVPKAQLALMLITTALVRTGAYPLGALRDAAAGPFEAENLNAVEAGVALAG